MKAIPIERKEVKKSTFYLNPIEPEFLVKLEEKVVEDINKIEKWENKKSMNKQVTNSRLKKANSQKNYVLIRPPKLKKFAQQNFDIYKKP